MGHNGNYIHNRRSVICEAHSIYRVAANQLPLGAVGEQQKMAVLCFETVWLLLILHRWTNNLLDHGFQFSHN